MPSSPRARDPRHPALASLMLIALCLLPARSADANDGASLLPLLREQRREADERERQQRLRQLTAPSAINVPDEIAGSRFDSEQCWPISGVRLAGNMLISPEALNRVLEPLLQPCMDEARINAALKAITRTYLEQGYLAARPYLANAPAAGASLDIVIVEGFVESVEFDDPELPLSLSRAFPDLVGAPLTLAALEQGLNQMNRLQSFDLSADLEPGELQGGDTGGNPVAAQAHVALAAGYPLRSPGGRSVNPRTAFTQPECRQPFGAQRPVGSAQRPKPAFRLRRPAGPLSDLPDALRPLGFEPVSGSRRICQPPTRATQRQQG